MTTRKHKAPEKRAGTRALRPAEPGLAERLLAAGLGVLSARPRETVVTTGFLVAFGWVSANALWYQPGNHPAPFLMTRDPSHPAALAGWTRLGPREDAPDVVTYRIEREDAAAAGDETASIADSNGDLIAGVQRELIRRGLMNGTPDGVLGPQTVLAVQRYEKKAGMPVSGLVTPELLAAMLTESTAPKVRVPDRPADVASLTEAPDPVAAAILSAEKPVVRTATLRSSATSGSSLLSEAELVFSIQTGLTNMAYARVAIDGVAGKETRAAIRQFERDYNLPETGEPSLAVLRKLKSFGALDAPAASLR